MVEPFAAFIAYPNPCRGVLSVRFAVPPAVAVLEYRVYDTRGRLVEEQVQRSSARAGVHQRVLEGRATTKGRLASGAYLLRISALEESGRVAARREHRFVVTP